MVKRWHSTLRVLVFIPKSKISFLLEGCKLFPVYFWFILPSAFLADCLSARLPVCLSVCLPPCLWCLDDPSTDKPTTRQFDPHYPSTQRTVNSDKSPLGQSYTYAIHSGIFHPPRLQGGWFVTRNMLSTPYYLSCDIMTPFWHVVGVSVWVHLPMDQCAVGPNLT